LLTDLLAEFGVEELRAISGFLYSPTGQAATLEDDERFGFVGESRRLVTELSSAFQGQPDFSFDQQRMNLSFRFASVRYSLETAYGDEVAERFCDEPFPVAKLLRSEYDDMWLALAVAMRERAMLSRLGTNATVELLEAAKEEEFFEGLRRFAESEGQDESALEVVVRDLAARLPEEMKRLIVSEVGDLDRYLADVVYVTAAYLTVSEWNVQSGPTGR